jgi:aspartate aminotransferase
MRSRVLERLEALEDGVVELREAGYPVDCVEPQGAMYLSLHLDWFGRKLDGAPLATNEDIRCAVLDGAGIAMVPFQAFGLAEDTGWFRLSVGAVTVEDIVTMFPRLRALMDRLQA